MRLTVLLVWALLSVPVAARPTAPFVDVPPCHWAADAVAELADLGIFIGFPRDDAYLAANALRQVFEGLRCDDPEWSRAFIVTAPDAFSEARLPQLAGFTLETTVLEQVADRAEIAYSLTAVIDHQGERRTELRDGTIEVWRGDDTGWRVAYAELAALDLPLFPRKH